MSRYDDIINLPHHKSAKHPQMSNYDRAAQFSPFASLTGYDDVIEETARVTEDEVELSEDAVAELDAKLAYIAARLESNPKVTITWFKPDDKKQGGAYIKSAGVIKKIDTYSRAIIFYDGQKIPFRNIVGIEEED